MAQGANDKTFWNKTKATAKKFTYKATISVKKRSILGVKQRLGVGVYVAFEEQDEAFARELFLKARAKIALLEDDIMNCELKIAEKCDLNYVPKFVPSAAPPRTFRTDRKKPLGGLETPPDEVGRGSSNQSYYSPKSKEWAVDGKTGDTHRPLENTKPSSCSSSSTRESNSMQTVSNHNTADSRESFHSTNNANSSEPSTPKSREFQSVEHRSASPEFVVAGRQSESDAQKQASTKSTQSLGIPYSKSSNNISPSPSTTSSSSNVSQRMAQYDGNSNHDSSSVSQKTSFGQNNHDTNVSHNASASQKVPLPQSSSSPNVSATKSTSSSQKMPIPPSHKPNLLVSAPTSTNSVPSKAAPAPVTANSFSSPSNNLSPKASTSAGASSSFSSPSNTLSPKSACASSASSPKAGSANWGAAESASRSASPSPSRGANWGSAETNVSNTPKSSPRAQSPSPRTQSPSPRAQSPSPSGGGGGGKAVSGTNALLLWTQQSTEGYNGVSITNFTSSWQSGIAFAALLHAHEPGLLDLSKLNPSQATATCQVAFDAAEKAGVAILVDAEDMKIGDKKCTIVQLQMYHKTLAHDPPSHAGRDAWNRKFH